MAVTTKTRAQLVERALQKLLVVGAGQSAEAEDAAATDAVVDAVLADLSARAVYTVTDEAEIDVAAFEWLADILADTVAPDFGAARSAERVMRAEAMLRKLGAMVATYEPLRATYY